MYDYSYGYDYGTQAATGLAAFGVGMLFIWLISVAISVFTIICNWKVFKKAGKPGWASIIPIYNTIVMIEIAELPMWYIALFFVPFANIYAIFKINIEIAHKFGKSTGFGVGMTLLSPIFMAILAFGKDANYKGVQNVGVQQAYQQPTMQQSQPVAPVAPTPVVETQPQVEPVNPMPEVQPVAPAPVVEPQPVEQPTVNQSVTPVFCTNCGNALMPNTKFCTNCGKQI